MIGYLARRLIGFVCSREYPFRPLPPPIGFVCTTGPPAPGSRPASPNWVRLSRMSRTPVDGPCQLGSFGTIGPERAPDQRGAGREGPQPASPRPCPPWRGRELTSFVQQPAARPPIPVPAAADWLRLFIEVHRRVGGGQIGFVCTRKHPFRQLALFRTSHFTLPTSNYSSIGFVCTTVFQPATDYRLLPFGFVSHES
jgi:hypothetical protein